jgi:hypothetical protein
VDPEGETLHARDLVHFMRRLNVKGLANILKLSKGTPEHVDYELSVVDERSSSVSLVDSSFPLFNFLQQQLSSSSSSSLRPRFDDGGPLNVISSFVISR